MSLLLLSAFVFVQAKAILRVDGSSYSYVKVLIRATLPVDAVCCE